MLLADRIIVLGRNPGHVRTDFRVEIAHLRDRKAPMFTHLVDFIYKVLTRPDVQADCTRAAGSTRSAADALPDAAAMRGRAEIAGLLELLIDKNGRDDIYRLADDLAFEIDDLLPIVDAAALLGFLKVEEGDAVITPTGRAFAESEIQQQKELFRQAAIENVLLLRQITRALDTKSNHTVPEEFFLDMLDEQFSQEETLRQLETAINWGRYSELFDFDASRRRFVRPEAEEETAETLEEEEGQLSEAAPDILAVASHRPFMASGARPHGRGSLPRSVLRCALRGALLVQPA